MSTTPYTIRAIMQQIGTGLHGGLCYIGAHNVTYTHPDRGRDGECRPDFPSEFKDGHLRCEIALIIPVNGKPRERWTEYVCYEADDTYTVWLLRRVKGEWQEINHRRDVYCDELQSAVERMYDDAINKTNGGFIPC